MTLHIPKSKYFPQIAREVAAELDCLIGLTASDLYRDHMKATITGNRAEEWRSVYSERIAQEAQP